MPLSKQYDTVSLSIYTYATTEIVNKLFLLSKLTNTRCTCKFGIISKAYRPLLHHGKENILQLQCNIAD